MIEKTLSIIKPDGTRRNIIGKILAHFENHQLKIAAIKKKHLNKHEAEIFYGEHKSRPFFGELVEFIWSDAVVLIVLEGENAIEKNRTLMGATNPSEAEGGTIRKLYAKSIGENTVHGSDSLESAKREIRYFFSESEIC